MLRLDETGFGNMKVYQETDEFCYGVDAVMLSDFASANIKKPYDKFRIMDLGTGSGIIPVILAHKTEAGFIGGIEVQEGSYNLCRKNLEVNNLEGRVEFFHSNVKDFATEENRETFSLVTSNPPYMKGSCGIKSANEAKGIARHETLGTLEDFVKLAAWLLKDKGEFCMVHRPSRLVDICEMCRAYRLEPKEIRFVSGKPMEKPNILLVRCVKNGNRELKVLEPLSVYENNGTYSEEILKMYEKK